MKFKGWVKYWGIVFWFTPKWVAGITIFPFVFIRPKLKEEMDEHGLKVLINHEQIHIAQQAECLVLPWYLMYGLNYVVNLIRFKGTHFESYYNICFEREAYQNEGDLEYLDKRKQFIWKKYFK